MSRSRHRRLVVVGFDGATLDLVLPWAAAGRLPVLGRILARGAWGRVRSTLPAATFPAWTSLVTGVNPGRHGLFDFTEKVKGRCRLRFLGGADRCFPACWEWLGSQGRRVATALVPATYPPDAVNGVMIAGFDTPLAAAVVGSYVFPRSLHREIRRAVGTVPFAGTGELGGDESSGVRVLERLLAAIERKTALARFLLAREPWDFFMIVFGESDAAAHRFWRYHDSGSPRHHGSGVLGGALAKIYERLDRALGEIAAAAPKDAVVAVVSDHGFGGAGDKAVHLNRRLEEMGLARLKRSRVREQVQRGARAAALRWLPPRARAALARRAGALAARLEEARRFGHLDWRRTAAFSEELDYNPSVWINLREREPYGIVDPCDYEKVRDEVAAGLEAWRDPWTGKPIVARVWRREELYHGPHVARAPDLIVELALDGGYSYSCLPAVGGPAVRRLEEDELGGARGLGLNGTHRREGLVALAGDGVRPGELPVADIVDVLPTLLALAGVPVPVQLDGKPIEAALDSPVDLRLSRWELPERRRGQGGRAGWGGAQLAARLAALGYIGEGPV